MFSTDLAITAVSIYAAGAGAAGRAGAVADTSAIFSEGRSALATQKIHGNSLASLRPTWGYRLFHEDGTFLKNGITSEIIPEARGTQELLWQTRKCKHFRFPTVLRLECGNDIKIQ